MTRSSASVGHIHVLSAINANPLFSTPMASAEPAVEWKSKQIFACIKTPSPQSPSTQDCSRSQMLETAPRTFLVASFTHIGPLAIMSRLTMLATSHSFLALWAVRIAFSHRLRTSRGITDPTYTAHRLRKAHDISVPVHTLRPVATTSVAISRLASFPRNVRSNATRVIVSRQLRT